MPGFQPIGRSRQVRLLLLIVCLVLAFQLPGERVAAAAPGASSVSVTLSNPGCSQVLPASGSCSILLRGINAAGSDASFSRLEVLINGKLRLNEAGFFESTATFDAKMMAGGLKVSCGSLGSGGNSNYGKAYLVAVNAYMADGASASASATVYCPAYDSKTYLPSVRR